MGEEAGLSVSLSLVPSHLDPQGPTPLPQHHCSEPVPPLNFVPSESPAFHMAFTVGASHFQPQGPHGVVALSVPIIPVTGAMLRQQ